MSKNFENKGHKIVELRSWPMQERFEGQRIVIHAAASIWGGKARLRTMSKAELERILGCAESATVRHALERAAAGELQLSAGVGTVSFGPSRRRRGVQGGYSWPVQDFRKWRRPVPCNGKLGIFRWGC